MTDQPTATVPEPETSPEVLRDRILDAALLHVPFDGWTQTSFDAAVGDTGIDGGIARSLFPRGPLDLALAFHARGDAVMVARLQAAGIGQMRVRDRIATAVRYRLEAAEDREAVRRGATLFALPQNAADGARAIWQTSDLIWTTLGDPSQDFNWYSKRAILAGVYSSTLLYWLGDTSPGQEATWAFLDRRIDDVMAFEKAKTAIDRNPVFRAATAGPRWLLGQLRAPGHPPPVDMPGFWRRDP